MKQKEIEKKISVVVVPLDLVTLVWKLIESSFWKVFEALSEFRYSHVNSLSGKLLAEQFSSRVSDEGFRIRYSWSAIK